MRLLIDAVAEESDALAVRSGPPTKHRFTVALSRKLSVIRYSDVIIIVSVIKS